MIREAKSILKKINKEIKEDKHRIEEVDNKINEYYKLEQNINMLKRTAGRGYTDTHKEELQSINEELDEVSFPKSYGSKFKRLYEKFNSEKLMEEVWLKKDDITIAFFNPRNIDNDDDNWYGSLKSSKCGDNENFYNKWDRLNFNPEECVKDMKKRLELFDELLHTKSRDLDQYNIKLGFKLNN